MLFDMYRGEPVVLHHAFADNDGVLEVVALPAHESHQHVLAEGQFALSGRRAVGKHLATLDKVAFLDDGPLVYAGALVATNELQQPIFVLDPIEIGHRYQVARRLGHDSLGPGQDDLAAVTGDSAFHAGADERRLRPEQRHRLPLHVGTHQGAVRVVVLQERNECSRDADKLHRRNVHVADVLRRLHSDVFPDTGLHPIIHELSAFIQVRVCLRDVHALFLVRRQIDDFVVVRGHIWSYREHLLRQLRHPVHVPPRDRATPPEHGLPICVQEVFGDYVPFNVRVGVFDLGVNSPVRRFDEPVLVGPGVCCEGAQ